MMRDKGFDKGDRSDRGDRGDRGGDRGGYRGSDRGGDDGGIDNQSLRKVIRNKYRTDLKGDHVFDYKDPASLSRYISEGGKITPARISKLSLNQQKKLAAAIKKARNLSLLPQGTTAYDENSYPEQISAKPFTF